MGRALFLFNHDAGHQVAHLAGVAAATARIHRDIETVVAYGSPEVRSRLCELISPDDAALIRWEHLALPRTALRLAKALDRFLPASRLARLMVHKKLFESADMIVSTERTCLHLKRIISKDRMPLFAKIPHGAGDRSVAYHPDYRRFDRTYVAGQKVVDQLVAHGVERERLAIIGYPKFETVDLSAKTDLFGNGNPTFLYNPHFDPHLSSWYDAGPDILRWFASADGQAFNLIFAPHVMLFKKHLHISPEYKVSRRRPDIPPEAHDAPNILVDTDGPRLLDMTYALGADCYIGDVSSQIYEFLARPRPAFFVDCRDDPVGEEDDWHLFWDAGPVVKSVGELTDIIADYRNVGAKFRKRQEEIFRYTIDQGDRPASERAAEHIAECVRSHADR